MRGKRERGGEERNNTSTCVCVCSLNFTGCLPAAEQVMVEEARTVARGESEGAFSSAFDRML